MMLPMMLDKLCERERGRHTLMAQRLAAAVDARLQRERHRHELLSHRIKAADPQAMLARGYSITRTADGHVVRSVAQLTPGQTIASQLADGTILSQIIKPTNTPEQDGE